MENILLFGGTGFVGAHVCEKLARFQCAVTVPTRGVDRARHLWPLPHVTVVSANVHDEAALARLLPGHDAVVNLVAILHGTQADFDQVHVALPQKLARACAAAGVTRLVHVSALGAAPDAPSMYLRSKAAGEAALQAAHLQATVLRPSVIFGAEDRFLNLFARLQKWMPLVPLAGAQAHFQPVWVEDVAEAVVRCLQRPRTAGQTFEACGPDVLTLRELVSMAGQWSGANGGRGRPVLALPGFLARLQARIMELVPGQPLMSRDNLDSMRVDNVASGQWPDLEALGIAPAAVSAIAPGYLAGASPRGKLLDMRKTARQAPRARAMPALQARTGAAPRASVADSGPCGA